MTVEANLPAMVAYADTAGVIGFGLGIPENHVELLWGEPNFVFYTVCGAAGQDKDCLLLLVPGVAEEMTHIGRLKAIAAFGQKLNQLARYIR